ncbi:MAG: hypothetical protein E7339_00255 [Clostridiales bacterium]|nr:hypothetical protein [Clostridiales bacterium]
MKHYEAIIEEMCKDFKCCVSCEMFNGFIDDNGELKDCSCAEHSDRYCTQCYISTRQAKTLYNAGYRKIPEGSVVLSKEEYNDLKGLEKHFDDYLIKEIKETRKETTKEILREVSKVCADYQWFKNLCKQFGVEVKNL